MKSVSANLQKEQTLIKKNKRSYLKARKNSKSHLQQQDPAVIKKSTTIAKPGKSSIAFGEDDNDLLSDISFTGIDSMSPTPQNRKKSNMNENNLKRATTVVPNHQQSKSQVIQMQATEMDSSNKEEKEEIDEGLINDIENYLKEVMEQNEKVMDISETPIGNYGAKCVAAVITLCDGLEEIRLSGCGIKDEGAIAMFEELKQSESVLVLELNNNNLTEKVFDSLLQLLQINKRLERIELKGITIKNKFAVNKLKPYANRVVM